MVAVAVLEAKTEAIVRQMVELMAVANMAVVRVLRLQAVLRFMDQ